jgi:hypothetical protein
MKDADNRVAQIQDIFCGLIREADWPGPEGDEEPVEDWYGFKILNDVRERLASNNTGSHSEKPDVLEPYIRSLSHDELLFHAGKAICGFLNARNLSPLVVMHGESFVEVPPRSDRGILPQLLSMLRQDCLGQRHVSVCARPECGALFYVHRYRQRFCSEDCSRRQRQREYYVRKGKQVRRQRLAIARRPLKRKS